MEHQIFTESLRGLSGHDREGMFRLRYDTFHVKLGWDVAVTPDGQEIDEFDSDPSAKYILARSPGEHIDACWRLLPTLGPYMLKDTFPELLSGQPAPESADVWELSRFARATRRNVSDGDPANAQLGFGQLSVALMTEAAKFAQVKGIARYVTVTTTAIERMLMRQGLHIHRIGPPQRLGSGHELAVACFIEVDAQTLQAIGLTYQ